LECRAYSRNSRIQTSLDAPQRTNPRHIRVRILQWLGEVSALEENLRNIADEKRQAERRLQQAETEEIGPDALD
jgi:hypothetical protein